MTTIKIKNDTKEKLEALKKEGQTYDQLLQSLIQHEPGANINDVTEISREKIAFEVEHTTLNKNNEIIKTNGYNVSYYELSQSEVGNIFEIQNNDEYYIHEKAEILYKDKISVFVRTSITTKSINEFSQDTELLHIQLF